MGLFQTDPHQSDAHRRVYANYEIARTAVDFLAAVCFVAGSACFFFSATETLALWLFLVGSILFAVKPTLKLAREMHLNRLERLL